MGNSSGHITYGGWNFHLKLRKSTIYLVGENTFATDKRQVDITDLKGVTLTNEFLEAIVKKLWSTFRVSYAIAELAARWAYNELNKA